MKAFTNIFLGLFVLLSIVLAEEDATILYDRTKICAKHKSYLCLSYSNKHSMIVLSGSRKLNFEIETVERVNMQLNRVYTFAVDKATRKKVKSCLVRKTSDDGALVLDLAPCDTDERELVLAVEVPEMDLSKVSADEFVLKEISYLDDGSTLSSPYCISASTKKENVLQTASSKRQLKSHTPVILSECGKNEGVYGQEFKARNFKRSTSQRLPAVVAEPEIKAEIGMFCLSETPDLCLGISLANGTDLVSDKLAQVKSLSKNAAKGKVDYKMRWYRDLQNNRVANAADMDLCLEAVYNAPIGENRRGVMQYDDVVHLGACDQPAVQRKGETEGRMAGLVTSEQFYINDVVTPTGSYLEIRTNVPGEDTAKCVSVIKCVRHTHGHCTPYNSVPVYSEVEWLQPGAHARLKDCNSEEMVSQRFFYISDDQVTMPPTKYPTQEPTSTPKPTTTPEPTSTPPPTDGETPAPTPKPTFFVEPAKPDDENEEGSQSDPKKVVTSQTPSLLIALAMIGVLLLLIILVALAYYYKNRNKTGLPEEDENFIARV